MERHRVQLLLLKYSHTLQTRKSSYQICLTHWGRVMHICLLPDRCQLSHYLNHCWNIVNWNCRYKLQWNFNRNSCIFIEINAFKISSGKWRPFCLSLNVFIMYKKITYLNVSPSQGRGTPLLQLVDCTVWIIIQVTTECVVEQNLRVWCGKASGLFDTNYMHCYKRKKINKLESVSISKDHLSKDSHCKHNTASRQSYRE